MMIPTNHLRQLLRKLLELIRLPLDKCHQPFYILHQGLAPLMYCVWKLLSQSGRWTKLVSALQPCELSNCESTIIYHFLILLTYTCNMIRSSERADGGSTFNGSFIMKDNRLTLKIHSVALADETAFYPLFSIEERRPLLWDIFQYLTCSGEV